MACARRAPSKPAFLRHEIPYRIPVSPYHWAEPSVRAMDTTRLITRRALDIDASGIRRVFELGAKLKDPINLSIGQPDFPVPDPIKNAAAKAIADDKNGYTLTQGIAELRNRLAAHLKEDLNWDTDSSGLAITSGTSGALLLAFLALLGPGDEVIIPDPYFVIYPALATLAGARAVRCQTYPDLRLTAERIEPLITDRTKILLFNSPSNPAGIVSTTHECQDLLELCRARGILLISDEIYDEFTYSESRTDVTPGTGRAVCPSPARLPGAAEDVLLVRGFGKTYGITGWRMGYAAGPKPVIEQITKLQQYTFVCAPAPLQWGAIAALDFDMTEHIAEYRSRRDMVVERLSAVTELSTPGGAFYAFPKVPDHLGQTAGQFVDTCIEKNVLVISGNVFSDRDTHFRLSYATRRDKLEQGLDILVDLLRG